jgi:parvulin-like peptidyl-prolyl isomerase
MALGLLAFLWACETDSRGILARAAGHELTVDQMVEILARENTVPNRPAVVDQLANFWVDYTLIAVRAREDSLFTELDLEALLQPQLEQETIDAYMNSILQPDTAISDQELRTMWDADPPADSIRAQHILLTVPAPATEAQVDSVANFAEQLRARAEAGESFGTLAGQYSEDTGSAVQGGDIGFFGRGMLFPAFEEAAFSMAVGEVGGPVASSFGLHVIKVTERKATTFEAGRDNFRDSLVAVRLRAADSTLLAEIEEEGEIVVEAGAVEVLRELAMNPRTSRGGRATRRALVSFRGGSYSVSDALLLLNTRQADLPDQLAVAPDEALDALLNRLGQAQLLLARAADAGISPDEAHVDSLDALARQRLREATDELGLRSIALLEGETADEALDRTTLQVLREISGGTRNVIPMASIIVSVREESDWNVFESGIGATVERIDDLRGTVQETPIQPVPIEPSAPPAVDSVQN